MPNILPLTIKADTIPFTDWVSLLTLCFAPVIAHIAAGAPTPTILARSGPRWHDLAVLYNPTTILWRYFAVANRRLRVQRGAWSPAQVAATNAVFWTAHGWDGSEGMVVSSQRFTAVLPELSRAKLLSASTLKSLIVTLQGVQALWLLIGNINGGSYAASLAIDSIFGPLAIFGLLRLCAALWLIEDDVYCYVRLEDSSSSSSEEEDVSQAESYHNTTPTRFALRATPSTPPAPGHQPTKPPLSWPHLPQLSPPLLLSLPLCLGFPPPQPPPQPPLPNPLPPPPRSPPDRRPRLYLALRAIHSHNRRARRVLPPYPRRYYRDLRLLFHSRAVHYDTHPVPFDAVV